MRRWVSVVLLAVVVAISAAAVGCDYGSDSSSKAGSTKTKLTEEQALAQAIIDTTEDLKSFTCSFEVKVKANIDMTEVPESDLSFMGMLKGPIKVTGTFSFDDKTQAAQLDLLLGAAGITYNMGARALGDKAWVLMLGQWYDLSEAIEQGSATDPAAVEPDPQVLIDRMAELKVEPLAWLGSIKLIGQENLDGAKVNHLESVPDVDKVLADLIVLMKDEKFIEAIDPSGQLSGLMSQDTSVEDGLNDMRDTLPEMLSGFALNVWAGKGNNLLNKVNLAFLLQPPVGEPSDGLDSLDVAVELKFTDMNKPVEIKAPESFLSFEAFQEMFGGMSSPFPMPLIDEPTTDSISKN